MQIHDLSQRSSGHHVLQCNREPEDTVANLHGFKDAAQKLLSIVLPAVLPLLVMLPTCFHEPAVDRLFSPVGKVHLVWLELQEGKLLSSRPVAGPWTMDHGP